MSLRKITILTLAILLSLPMAGQKRKRTTRKPKPEPVIEEPQEDPRITNMRSMTQQIIFIDSVVTDKDQFLASIHLSTESGQLMLTSSFFNNKQNGTLYINELRNKVYFSQQVDTLKQIFTSDKLGEEWSRPQRLKGINNGITETAYPFMLTDGVTLYFAGKGEESIGGYDIFMTRYDSRSGNFLKPENIGMPFNSEANDYMYAIDEANHIGYFVSDRRQPEGKVCIYIFIPSDTRKSYDSSVFSEEQIRNLADITSIADTWGDGTLRKAAIERIKKKHAAPTPKSEHLGGKNKEVEFHSTEAKFLYEKLTKEKDSLDVVNARLTELRSEYHKANANEKNKIKHEILKLENNVLVLNANIKKLAKATRNAEINNKK